MSKDAISFFQLVISVYDDLRPLTRTQCTLVINVDRNPSRPIVAPFDVTIEERIVVGTNFFNVSASDPDGVSICRFLFWRN